MREGQREHLGNNTAGVKQHLKVLISNYARMQGDPAQRQKIFKLTPEEVRQEKQRTIAMSKIAHNEYLMRTLACNAARDQVRMCADKFEAPFDLAGAAQAQVRMQHTKPLSRVGARRHTEPVGVPSMVCEQRVITELLTHATRTQPPFRPAPVLQHGADHATGPERGDGVGVRLHCPPPVHSGMQ